MTTNIINCFPWSDRLPLFILRKRLPNTQSEKAKRKKKIFHEKKQLVQLSKLRCLNTFPRDTHYTLECSKSSLCIFPILLHRIFWKVSIFDKINHFHCFSKDILKWNWHLFFTAGVWQWLVQLGGRLNSCSDAKKGLPTIYFPPSVKMSKSKKWKWKKQKKHDSIIMKIVLTSWTPQKCHRDPQGSMDHTLRTAGIVNATND